MTEAGLSAGKLLRPIGGLRIAEVRRPTSISRARG